MASVKHKFVSVIADDPTAAAAGDVLPSHWNDDHSVSFAAETFDSITVAGSSTFSATAVFLTDVRIAGDLQVGSTASFSALRVTSVIAFQGAVTCAATFAQQAQATFSNTVTFSATVVFNTSINVSATASIGILVVAGSATMSGPVRMLTSLDVSATISAGFLIVGGSPVAASSHNKLASTAGFAGSSFFIMSGAWTAYQSLELDIQGKGGPTTTNLIIALYTDGGTTPFMVYTTNPIASATASDFAAHFLVTGSKNTQALKVITPLMQMFAGVTNQAGQFPTATFTVSAINAIGICTGVGATTTTMSSADIYLYGRGV